MTCVYTWCNMAGFDDSVIARRKYGYMNEDNISEGLKHRSCEMKTTL